MLYLVLYIIASLVIVVIFTGIVMFVSYLLKRKAERTEQKKRLTRIEILAICIIAALPFMPYAIIECQTYIFRSSVLPAAHESMGIITGDSTLHSMKVLRITPETACIYVVGKEGSDYRAHTAKITRINGKWRYMNIDGDRDAIWSDTGSAHGSIFPPYPPPVGSIRR